MPIEKWSERVRVVHLADDPLFTDDMQLIESQCAPPTAGTASHTLPAPPPASAASSSASPGSGPCGDLVLDFAAVHFVNSSNIARMLRLRKLMHARGNKLILCSIPTTVWGTFLVTGLDKVFEFSDNVPTALASLQLK
jgi:anti-anti-sigma factor